VIRVIDRPLSRATTVAGEPCDACGSVMLPAKRFEATRTVAVLICWDCGAEHPPLYTKATTVPAMRARTCVWCGATFRPDGFLPGQTTCSLVCADARQRTSDRSKRNGQTMRRRA
jgi:hypothetical protein